MQLRTANEGVPLASGLGEGLTTCLFKKTSVLWNATQGLQLSQIGR